MVTRNEFLRDFAVNNKTLDYSIDAIGYFFCEWGDDASVSDYYKYRCTDSRQKAEKAYLFCSETLYEDEFEISDILDTNDKNALIDYCNGLESKIETLLV